MVEYNSYYFRVDFKIILGRVKDIRIDWFLENKQFQSMLLCVLINYYILA